MKEKVVTISNVLSLSRIALMVPVVLLLMSNLPQNRLWAIAVIIVAMITDILDGYFARRRNEISEVGKVIDPLADKIGIGIVVVLLTVFDDIPLWFAVSILVRDGIIFCGGIYIKLRTGLVLTSTMTGKIAVVCIAVTLVLAMLRNPMFHSLTVVLIDASTVVMLASLIFYGKRFFEVLHLSKTSTKGS